MTATLSHLIDRHGIDVLDHLDRSELVPVLSGLQPQGDVAVIPAAMAPGVSHGDLERVPAGGVVLVRGQHAHTLIADGDVTVTVDVADPEGLAVAVVDVADGATGWLAHVEHGYLGIGPGLYTVRRQREQADSIRMVAD